ncbi:MAG: L-aspartate oxidase [Xanthobacter sp.]
MTSTHPALSALHGQPVIIGAGLAGLSAALFLAPRPVVLLSRGALEQDGSSPLAQGGMAAAMADDDSVELHLADTLAAGAGLCDRDVAERILTAAPQAIEELLRIGTAFDRTRGGALALGLEAAHSRHRIVHAHGDGTGREAVRALSAAVRVCPSITVLEHVDVRRLLVMDGALCGVMLAGEAEGAILRTRQVVLATGGAGALFAHTTNPASSFGTGLALAARAGAELADLEFVQFHPTALALPGMGGRRTPLISEAVRGEGALLVNGAGERFMAGIPGAELAPRDVVARAVWAQLQQGEQVFLDARTCLGAGFATRFPAISAACAEAGINPATDLIPIRPAAHYHMGGIAVDARGRSTVEGLWACGEVASTGLHGANRLASNSLVEAVVCGRWVAQDIAGIAMPMPDRRVLGEMPPAADPAAARALLSRHLGVLRHADGLTAAVRELLPLAEQGGQASDPALVGLMMALCALQREESRGGHFRTDFPTLGETRRSRITLAAARSAARALEARIAPASTSLDQTN